MEDKYSNNELLQITKSIENKVIDGFKGVHDRQDKTNGQVDKNTKFRYESKAQLRVWKWITGFLGLEGVVIIIMFLMGYFNKGG